MENILFPGILAVLNINFYQVTEKNFLKVLNLHKKFSLKKYNVLLDIVVYDIPSRDLRFTVKYVLSNFYQNQLEISFQINELTVIPTISVLYKSANWLEREVWDFYGIFFSSQKDLRHILLDYGYNLFPLRKDFPVVGYTETIFDDKIKKLTTIKTQLLQEPKIF